MNDMARILLFILSVLPVSLLGQFKVTIIVAAPAPITSSNIYIAGGFNNWMPNDPLTKLSTADDGKFVIRFSGSSGGKYEFKFTCGSWQTVETAGDGKDVGNREIVIGSDTTLYFTVAAWKTTAASSMKQHTTSKNVQIIDTSFMMPQLGRTRRIWIYLPTGYASSSKRYPVLYMHDGQNLFDEATAFSGEWSVDEAMDSVANACIVVGIDNGGSKRMNEYNPNDTEKYGKGEGKEYLAFIVETLKPYIDKQYRTIKDKQHTWMAGSSMGGLITFYAGLYYPNIFGGLGVFSPSFGIVPDLPKQIEAQEKKAAHGKQSWYFYAGAQESKQMVPDMHSVAMQLQHLTKPDVKIDVNPAGKHNEPTWKAVFPAFYSWLVKQ
jgi:predicted alpha/beta superfamily hydrolase